MSSATATAEGAEARDPAPRRRSTSLLRRYRSGDGSERELVMLAAAHGSRLIVDRERPAGGDQRLVAHLAADEPSSNDQLAALQFLRADPAARRCRALEESDRTSAPPGATPTRPAHRCEEADRLPAGPGRGFALVRVAGEMSIPSLRWTRRSEAGDAEVVSLRDAIAARESYEPFREQTRAAIDRHEQDPAVSITVLRAELSRVLMSPIVLNRGLREAVVAKISRGEASMSEIAIRCGRLKADARATTGETSWLARRIGLLPEGGQREPTRWVHSDVLGLIARQGLGVAPREVELG